MIHRNMLILFNWLRGIKMKTVYIETNTCEVGRHDTNRLSEYFKINGYLEIDTPNNANIIVVTGCVVTEYFEDCTLEMIKKLNVYKPDVFIVAGCVAKIVQKKILKINDKIILIPNDSIEWFDKTIKATHPIKSISYNANPTRYHHIQMYDKIKYTDDELEQLNLVLKLDDKFETSKFEEIYNYMTFRRYMWKEKDLFEIKVSSGCPYNCSYCITKKAIGKFVSRNLDVIINEFENGLKQGFNKFMLIGDEIGCYGKDIGLNLMTLIEKLCSYEGNYRIGIRYIHPDCLINYYHELEPYIKNNKLYYFCSAFQSGSERILSLMNRNDNLKEYIKVIKDMNNKKYNIYKHTQVIVGFPSETHEDFMKTIEVLNECKFDYISPTPFSAREGTDAFKLNNQLSPVLIHKRYTQMLSFVNENREKILQKRIYDELKNVLLNLL